PKAAMFETFATNSAWPFLREVTARWSGLVRLPAVSIIAGRGVGLSGTFGGTGNHEETGPRQIHWLADWYAGTSSSKKVHELFESVLSCHYNDVCSNDSEQMLEAAR